MTLRKALKNVWKKKKLPYNAQLNKSAVLNMRIERVTKMFAEIEYSMKNDLASEQSDVPLYADVPTEPGS